MTDPVNTAAPGPGGAEAQVSSTAAVDDANKVFAGNLAFSTTEDELKSVFAEAGSVTHIQIIKRGTRSLGYGFVTFATEAEAQKAVSSLDKKEIAGREINVEGAKPQLLARHNDSGNTTGEGADGKGKSGNRRRNNKAVRGARNGGTASSRRPRTDEGEEGTEEDVKENGAGKKATNGAKPARQPRKPKGPPEGEPSKTLLFVANLPFRFTDEQLKEAFAGYQVKTAKVIKRFYGSRTKGFGFVDLETEEEQQRALKEVNGKTVEGRALSLKVAIQGEDRKAAKEAEEADAQATA